jgi:cytochrome bd ubiquinol oxidase subunit I
MDALMLSRLQFAFTSMFHFVFVPLTLGLSVLLAWMEWRYVKTGDTKWLRMSKFWGKLFLINFAVGVVTGITLEFQFGMNWAEYSKYVGDIFGAPLAIEATVAFFLESVFIGVWIFGWDRVSKKMHALAITIVAFATNLSALWILLANGWMQNPVGATVSRFTANPFLTERAEMSDFIAVLTNPYGWLKFFHTVLAGYTVAAFFVMGISAWHIMRRKEDDFFKSSFKLAAWFGLASCILVIGIGDLHGADVAKIQPTKLAAMEAIWETSEGGSGFPLIAIPNEAKEENMVEALVIPKLASLLAYGDPNRPIKGLRDFPKEERPPVAMTFYSFRLMVGIGSAMALLLIVAVFLSWKGKLEQNPAFLKILLWSIPLPYIAGLLGWIVAEVGRQPWIVYGMLKTSDGVSKSLDASQAALSLAVFIVLYSFLGIVDFYLLFKYARKGPEPAVGERGLKAATGEV